MSYSWSLWGGENGTAVMLRSPRGIMNSPFDADPFENVFVQYNFVMGIEFSAPAARMEGMVPWN